MPLSNDEIAFLDDLVGSPDNMVPSMDTALQTDPDRYAENLRLVESEGLPLDTVERNRDKIDQRNRLNSVDFVKLRETNPGLTSYLSDPDNAGVSSDDVDNLKRIEDVLTRYERPWYEEVGKDALNTFMALGAGVASVPEMAPKGAAEFNRQFGRWFTNRMADVGFTGASEFIRETELPSLLQGLDPSYSLEFIGRGWEEIREGILPEQEEQGWHTDIAQAVGQLTGQVGLGVMSGGSTLLSSGLFGLMGFEQAAERARAAGATDDEIAAAATLSAGATVVSEKLGLDALLKRIPPNIKNKVLRSMTDVLASAGIESFQEYAEGVLHNLSAKFIYDPEAKVWTTDGREEISAGAAAGILRTVIHGVTRGRTLMTVEERAAEKVVNGDMERVGQTLHEQAILDEAVELAQSSATLGRAPERYSAFLAKVGKDTEIVIDGAALEGVEGLPDYIDPSLGDAEIGAELFMRDIASNPELMEQLRPHIKMSHDAMNQTEMEQDERADIRKLMERAQAAEDTKSEADRIFETVKDQLAATGRQSEETVRVSAQLYPAYATVLAERYKDQGETVESVFRDMGFQVVGPAETQVKAPEVELEQASATGYEGQDATEATEWNAAVAKGLGMTQESRMERAEAMGFDTGIVYNHETVSDELISVIDPDAGRFGGLFALEEDRAGYFDKVQSFFIRGDVFGDNDVLDVISRIPEETSKIIRDNLGDVDIDAYSQYISTFDSIPAELTEDSFAELQKARGQIALLGGASAVTQPDEFGTSVMLLPGSGVRSVNAAFDPERAESPDLLAQADARDQKRINTLQQLQDCLRG